MKNIFKILAFILVIYILLLTRDAEHISPIDKLASQHKFNIFVWEMKNLPKQVIDLPRKPNISEEQARNYLQNKIFDHNNQIELFLEDEVSKKIKEKLGKKFLFPPLYVSIEKPPKVLIVSPRNNIYQQRAILLNNDIPLDDIEYIEKQIDSLDLSSIILDTGGFAAYPSIVNITKDYESMISTISHEWLHHYLFFFPLGRSYFKGGEMIFINETLADIFADEISKNHQKEDSEASVFFKFHMKETREKVDKLLLKGEIEKAENYMKERGNELNDNGFKIRKINQAYFAFYGNYGSSPSSTHNYHEKLTKLFMTFDSFEDFLNEIKMIDEPAKLESLINLRTYKNQ